MAEHFDSVTVIFCEICDFASVTRGLQPAMVVSILNDIYSSFDALVDDFSVHKVETVGQVYMAVSGCPSRTADHAEHAASFALGMQRRMAELRREDMFRTRLLDQLRGQRSKEEQKVLEKRKAMRRKQSRLNNPFAFASRAAPSADAIAIAEGAATFGGTLSHILDLDEQRGGDDGEDPARLRFDTEKLQIHVGLNTGRINAGIVGLENPRYKLFGDTVNTASRMESTCEPGHIQMSGSTAKLLAERKDLYVWMWGGHRETERERERKREREMGMNRDHVVRCTLIEES